MPLFCLVETAPLRKLEGRFRALKSVAKVTPGSQSGFRFEKVATHFPTFGLSFKVNAGNNIPYIDAMGTEYNNEFN